MFDKAGLATVEVDPNKPAAMVAETYPRFLELPKSGLLIIHKRIPVHIKNVLKM